MLANKLYNSWVSVIFHESEINSNVLNINANLQLSVNKKILCAND